MSVPAGRFSEEAMRASLGRLATQLGIDAHDARLLRLTDNAVFALPAAGLVVRITRSHTLHARAGKNAALGAWSTVINAPTIRLADSFAQPIADGNLLATVWDWVPPAPPLPDAYGIGTVLRRFHALGLPPFELPG